MNPFGDDDEDFQTSEMLDFNLDISFRSSEAEEEMYPTLLKPAIMNYRLQEAADEDNLHDFIDDIENNLLKYSDLCARQRYYLSLI